MGKQAHRRKQVGKSKAKCKEKQNKVEQRCKAKKNKERIDEGYQSKW